jgi:hypothetical protein
MTYSLNDADLRGLQGSGLLLHPPTNRRQASSGESRLSRVFNSALPRSDSIPDHDTTLWSGLEGSVEQIEDETEVLFIAASLFEFNIAHDRREDGLPYLVYVPGEMFDVFGVKGELWLARNQDDHTKTVGWIWEKHFSRVYLMMHECKQAASSGGVGLAVLGCTCLFPQLLFPP